MDRQLLIDAAVGEEAHKFFDSIIGEYLLAKSLSVVAEQQARFENAENDDIQLMKDVHFKIKVAREAINWVNEALFEGEKAHAILEDQQGQ
jgi:hypothetical protein